MKMHFPQGFFIIAGLLVGTICLWALPSSYFNVPPEGIVTNRAFTTDELVNDIFAVGECELITNIESFGDSRGLGYFENGTNVIGLNRGIIISTGDTDDARGPNEQRDASTDFGDNTGDRDLRRLTDESIHDAVGIEFDFQSLDSIVTFRYVFASEEYCEFATSNYNDAFGFFISGPGINGPFTDNAKNIALIPGANDYVSINNINHLVNSNYYVNNVRIDDANDCNIQYDPDSLLNRIEYDGFTTELTAQVALIPCETYHIRLVIGDVKDNHFNSAVFLEAGSFNLGERVEIVSVNEGIDDQNLLEGCNNGYFHFMRQSESNLDFPLTVSFNIMPEGTAIEGVDYEVLPRSITIPAGESSYDLPVYAINDSDIEVPENIILTLDIPCACYEGGSEIWISDSPDLELNLPDIFVCQNGTNTLQPTIHSATPPYEYLWSTGSTDSSVIVDASGPLAYSVTITDDCGHTASASNSVNITTPPTANISGDIEICEESSGVLNVSFTGAAPFELVYSINGIEQAPIENINTYDYELNVEQEGSYEIISVTDQGCSNYGTGMGFVDIQEILPTIITDEISCFGENDGSIRLEVAGDNPPFDIYHEAILIDANGISSLEANTYTFTIIDAMGCNKTVEHELINPLPLSGIEINCTDLQSGIINLSATGGTAPYRYSIDGINYSAELFEALTIGGEYELHIQDSRGCIYQQDFLMPIAYDQLVAVSNTVDVNPGVTTEMVTTPLLDEAMIATYEWLPSEGLDCNDCPSPQIIAFIPQTVNLTVTDIFGCSQSYDIRINITEDILVFYPNVFSPNGDDINDYFFIRTNEQQVKKILELQIFDRWGGLVYQGTDISPNIEREGWDGTLLGRKMDVGTYVFVAKLLLYDDREQVYAGEILLMR